MLDTQTTKLRNFYVSPAFIFGVQNIVQLTWSNLSFFVVEKILSYPTLLINYLTVTF